MDNHPPEILKRDVANQDARCGIDPKEMLVYCLKILAHEKFNGWLSEYPTVMHNPEKAPVIKKAKMLMNLKENGYILTRTSGVVTMHTGYIYYIMATSSIKFIP